MLQAGEKIFIVAQFEGPTPASMFITEVEQDKATGDLIPVDMQLVDWSEFGGLWTPCAGSVSPWGTSLGSEEYEPDARAFGEVGVAAPWKQCCRDDCCMGLPAAAGGPASSGVSN